MSNINWDTVEISISGARVSVWHLLAIAGGAFVVVLVVTIAAATRNRESG